MSTVHPWENLLDPPTETDVSDEIKRCISVFLTRCSCRTGKAITELLPVFVFSLQNQ